MKNFFRFLLVFIGVILVYVYNNPEVVDKYKKDLTDFSESDSAVIVERDDVDKEKLTESDKTIATEKEDNVDNSQSAPIVVEKKSVNNDEIKFKSRKPIVRDKNSVDTATINALKCHFDLEKTDKTDYYYPKSAPSVNGNRYSNVRCFYAPVGVFNKCQVYYTFWLQMTVADSVTLDITKLSISADGLDFPISEKPEMVGPGYKGDFTAGYSIDLRNHQKMAWALYYAAYAKVVYESAGVKKEMLITAEELKYFRYSMDFYRSWIRCPKCVF